MVTVLVLVLQPLGVPLKSIDYFRNLFSSGATKCETSANRDEKDQKGQQEASTCVQDKIWSEDDVILDGFLTQHAADMRRPGGGIDQRRPCPSRGKGHDGERVEVEDGALRSEGGLKLMW